MIKKAGYLAFVVLVLGLCSMPLITSLLGYEAQNRENRPLAVQPRFILANGGINLAFPKQFDDYWSDHFGMREEMVTAFHLLTASALHDSLSEKVIIGQENMLYYANTLPDYLGIDRLSDQQIQKAAAILRIQQAYAQEIGSRFLFALAPNKNTIYPEWMPGYYQKTNLPSNRERLHQALSAHRVQYADLSLDLIAQKDSGLVYRLHDTHWNQKGALIAYRSLMNALLPDFAHSQYLDYEPQWKNDDAGDLHDMIFPSSTGHLLRPDYQIPIQYRLDEGARPAQDAVFATSSDVNEAVLLMMRDSFANALLPYFSSNTGRVYYQSQFPYSYQSVEQQKPDAILIELAERNIANLLMKAPVMPAPRAQSPGVKTNRIQAMVSQDRYAGMTRISGLFDASAYNPGADRILIEASHGEEVIYFEAFPIMEAQYNTEKERFPQPEGFTLLLPELTDEWDIRLIIDHGEQSDYSEECINVSPYTKLRLKH